MLTTTAKARTRIPAPLVALVASVAVLVAMLGVAPGAKAAAPATVAAPMATSATQPWQSGDPTFTAPSGKPPIQGVNYHGVWNDRNDATRARILDEFAAAGVEYVRLDISWAMIQPSGPNSYDMNYGVPLIDKRINEIAARGMKVLLLFYWGPSWSTGTTSKNGVPRDATEYGVAAAWAANRWKDNLVAMELWNEPDLSAFLSNTSPATHAALVKAAYPRIKAVAPDVTVIAGATTYVKDSWWKQFYANGGADHYDALGIHPYIGNADEAPSSCLVKYIESYPCNVANLIKLMQDNGDGDKDLWATEYGWSSHDNSTYTSPVSPWKRGVTKAAQAQNLIAMQEYMSQWPQVKAMFWYNDWAKVTGDAQEDNFALLERDFTRKPAYYAMKCVASGVCGPTSSPTTSPTATPTPTPTAPATYLVSGGTWRLDDSGTDRGTGWRAPAFDDSAWKSGSSEWGYGDGDEATTLTYGSNSANKPTTVYGRTTFDAGNSVADVSSLTLRAIVDDGAAVYLNGTEVWRFNLPAGDLTSTTKASRYIAGTEESTWQTVTLPAGALRAGSNTLAVEVHQDAVTSSDLSLNVELAPVRGGATPTPTPTTATPTPTPTPTPTLPAAPVAPTGLAASNVDQNSARLTWDTTPGADTYNLFRDTTKIADGLTTTSYTDTGLTANTGYRYTVKAANTGGTSPASPDVSVKTLPNAPVAPTGLAASSVDQNSARLTWDTTPGADTYNLFRDTTKIADNLTTTSYTDTGLTANTSYRYTVKAANTGGTSPASADVSVKTLPNAPAAPTGLAASSVDQNSARLTWDTTPGADTYNLFRDTTKIADNLTTTSYTDTGLTANTSYRYTVKAANTGGTSPASTDVSVKTLPNAPAAPTGLAATATSPTSASVTWNTTPGADTYNLFRDSTKIADGLTTTSYTDTGLSANTTYTYTVKAANTGGSSPSSTAVAVKTPAPAITSYLASGATWRYSDTGANLGTGWRAVGFADSAWRSGGSELGFGDGDERTTVRWGTDPAKKYITTYFRTTFNAGSSVGDVKSLNLRALVDDGAVVYLNGTEVYRFNLPTGTISSTTRASRYIAGDEERQWRTASLPVSALRSGTNTVAVEVHQDLPSSSDLTMNLELSPQR